MSVSDPMASYMLNGVLITPGPKRFRVGNRGGIGSSFAAVDPSQLAPVMEDTPDTIPSSTASTGTGTAAIASSGEKTVTGKDGRVYTFEYKDHTADIQLHSWGPTFERALESVAIAMFYYIAPPLPAASGGAEDEEESEATDSVRHVEKEGLVFNFLENLLSNSMVGPQRLCSSVEVYSLLPPSQAEGRSDWTAAFAVKGSPFSPFKHQRGTEVKAVTKSCTVEEKNGRWDIYIIVDI